MRREDVVSLLHFLSAVGAATGDGWPLADWSRGVRENLLAQFDDAPIQIGTRVVLLPPEVGREDDTPDWLGSEPFLCEGAMGVVRDQAMDRGEFVYGVAFEEDNWFDESKNLYVVREPYARRVFTCKVRWLAKVHGDSK